MTLTDDGVRITVTSRPWLIGKIYAGLFSVMAVMFPLILVVSLVRPPSMVTLACSRETARCAWGRGEVALDQVSRAEVRYLRGERNRSSAHRLFLVLRDGSERALTDAIFHDAYVAPMREAAAGVNRLVADPQGQALRVSFRARDTDWFVLVLFALVMPVAAWAFLKMWVERDVVIDRAQRTIRIAARGPVTPKTDETLPLASVREVKVTDAKWRRLSVVVGDDDERLVLVAPRAGEAGAQIDRLTAQLQELVSLGRLR